MIANIQSHNFKFCTIHLEISCIWSSEKMNKAPQIYDKVPEGYRIGFHCEQMHAIFYWLDEEVWILQKNLFRSP